MFASIIARNKPTVNPPDPHELVTLVHLGADGSVIYHHPNMPRHCAEALQTYNPAIRVWTAEEFALYQSDGRCPSCVRSGGLCRACEAALGAEADYYEHEAQKAVTR